MQITEKRIVKKDGKASIHQRILFDDGRATIVISQRGSIALAVVGDVNWEQLLEAVYTSVDEVLILNS